MPALPYNSSGSSSDNRSLKYELIQIVLKGDFEDHKLTGDRSEDLPDYLRQLLCNFKV